MEQRAYDIRLLLVFGFLLTWPSLGAAAPCYDLSKGQPAELTGILDYVVFAGPPNYENVQKGDTPEPSFVLRLAHPICIQGEKSADPETSFRAVQLVKTLKVQGKLKPLLHKQVTVTMKNPAPDMKHRQAPLFAWVTDIAPTAHQVETAQEHRTAASPPPIVPVPTPRHMEVAKAHGNAVTIRPAKIVKGHGAITSTHQVGVATAHGTAATTVRNFYAGLGEGRGDIASALVVPQKRARGPFSADELSRFYGRLKERIRLGKVETNGPSEFMVQYRYAASAQECNGRAIVKTVMLNGKNYIKSINALDGC